MHRNIFAYSSLVVDVVVASIADVNLDYTGVTIFTVEDVMGRGDNYVIIDEEASAFVSLSVAVGRINLTDSYKY